MWTKDIFDVNMPTIVLLKSSYLNTDVRLTKNRSHS